MVWPYSTNLRCEKAWRQATAGGVTAPSHLALFGCVLSAAVTLGQTGCQGGRGPAFTLLGTLLPTRSVGSQQLTAAAGRTAHRLRRAQHRRQRCQQRGPGAGRVAGAGAAAVEPVRLRDGHGGGVQLGASGRIHAETPRAQALAPLEVAERVATGGDAHQPLRADLALSARAHWSHHKQGRQVLVLEGHSLSTH